MILYVGVFLLFNRRLKHHSVDSVDQAMKIQWNFASHLARFSSAILTLHIQLYAVSDTLAMKLRNDKAQKDC